MAMYQQALGNNTRFTPRIMSFNCKYCYSNLTSNQCLLNGAHCIYLPSWDSEFAGLANNSYLAEESLRQKCLHYEYYDLPGTNIDHSYSKYFDYLITLHDQCLKSKEGLNKYCSQKVMKAVGVDETLINDCILSNYNETLYNGKSPGYNILKEDYEKQYRLNTGILKRPSVVINNITFRGDLEGYDIFTAVCAGFETKPDICKGNAIN